MDTKPALTQSSFDPLATKLSDDTAELRSYVVRNGRMTDQQRNAMQELYPKFGIAYEPGRMVDSRTLFGREAPFVVEIGFGMGDATAQIAQNLGDHCFLGLEVHAPGVGRLLSLVEHRGIDNLKVCRHDALDVVGTMIAPGSVDGFHIFFPDPWPKKRHHKRRLIRPSVLTLIAERLKTDGYLYFVTDWEEYAEAARELLEQDIRYSNASSGWAERKSWRPVTKFEQRALDEGRHIRELLFLKR